jgi:hydroxypyruvate isomerase
MTRRTALKSAAASAAAAAASSVLAAAPVDEGRLKQSVCWWTYQKWFTLDQLCEHAVRIGLKGIDLVTVDQWPTLQKHGLTPSMMTPGGGTIPDGFNRKENHDKLIAQLQENITKAAVAKVPNVITFSGNRRGMPDNEGLENCAVGLNKIKKFAEDKGVTVTLELLNSKVNHKDYMADHSAWGIELMKRVDSPRVKLLYDIYHMQIMEGDIIATIKQNIGYFAHFHTGGVPGRHEINGSQELNWRAVAKAIADTGYQGFVAHEFIPINPDPIKSLEQAFETCKV